VSEQLSKQAQLRKRFEAIAEERLAKMGHAWARLEETGSEEASGEFARELHTLKGESRMVGCTLAGEVAHAVEDAFGTLENDDTGPSVLGELILEGMDWIGRLVPIEHEEPPAGLTEFVSRLRAVGPLPLSSVSPRRRLSSDTESLSHVPTVRGGDHVRVSWDKLGHMRNAIAELMLARVRLTNSVGELQRIRRGALEEQAKWDGASYGQWVEMVEVIESRLRAEDFEFERLISVLEASSRDLRMVPIRNLFESYPRAVRTLSKETEREVTLHIEGDNVEVDRVILESISEPLLHLVRNAIDHGIEPPSERLAAGKNSYGTISLSAHVRGQNLELSVRDDGAGLGAGKVAKSAISSGFCSVEEVQAMEPEDVLRLVLLPKFTTRKKATQLSGRGIGLDVVLTTVESLGGSVDIDSRVGEGTTFTLVVPVSAAISTVVLMRVGGGSYALPGNAVLTMVDASTHPVRESGAGQVLTYQGRDIPVVDLRTVLDEDAASEHTQRLDRIVMMEDRGLLVALTGSSQHVEREAIVKPAAQFLSPRSPVRAVVPNPDGTLSLVIKPTEITAHARGLAPRRVRASAQKDVKHVLVVDDSPIVRELIVQALVSRGLKVSEAGDGVEALEFLEANPSVGLLVTDIEMPRMDGLELIRSLRERTQQKLTIIVVSMRGSEVERRRAFEAGADDYLVKTDFSQKNLWSLVSGYIR
jgi:two-component system, chemotaxis family, sensor kinase CheA